MERQWSFSAPGIYGPGRSALDTVRKGNAQRIFKEGQVFNRMYVDDIAAALEASLNNPHAGPLFNLCDDEPAPPPRCHRIRRDPARPNAAASRAD